MALKLTAEEFEEIRDGFNKIDKNGDGIISKSEFKRCLMEGKEDEEDAVDFFMKVYDLDGNGSIEFPEFLEMIAYFRYKKKPNDTQIRQLFRALDRDNKGLILVDDLRRFYKIFSADDLPEDTDLDAIIQSLDINGDGKINYFEFSNNYIKFERQLSNIDI